VVQQRASTPSNWGIRQPSPRKVIPLMKSLRWRASQKS